MRPHRILKTSKTENFEKTSISNDQTFEETTITLTEEEDELTTTTERTEQIQTTTEIEDFEITTTIDLEGNDFSTTQITQVETTTYPSKVIEDVSFGRTTIRNDKITEEENDITTMESLDAIDEMDTTTMTNLAENEVDEDLTTNTEERDTQARIVDDSIDAKTSPITEQIQTTTEIEDKKLTSKIDSEENGFSTTQISEVETTTYPSEMIEGEIFETSSIKNEQTYEEPTTENNFAPTDSIAITNEEIETTTTLAAQEFENELTMTTEGKEIQALITDTSITLTYTEQIQTSTEIEDNKVTTQIDDIETTTYPLTLKEDEIFESTSTTNDQTYQETKTNLLEQAFTTTESIAVTSDDDRIIYPDCDALDQFECGVGKCVPHEMVCDGIFDCENGLDEAECNHDFEEETFQNSFTPKKEATIQNLNDVNTDDKVIDEKPSPRNPKSALPIITLHSQVLPHLETADPDINGFSIELEVPLKENVPEVPIAELLFNSLKLRDEEV